MGKLSIWVFAFVALLMGSHSGRAQPVQNTPGLAQALLQGCLEAPGAQNTERLASKVGAKPYSDLRQRRELKTTTVKFPEPTSGEDQRTKVIVIEFRGWDLAGPGAGSLEYQAARTETDWVDRASQQPVKPVRTALGRSCRIHAPVANARAILELYERLNEGPYGIRISADRRWIDFFMFDENGFDIELSFVLQTPLAGVAADVQHQEGHLILSDGDGRYFNGTSPGIPSVTLTRMALLVGLDQQATMDFMNETIEPLVQRLQ